MACENSKKENCCIIGYFLKDVHIRQDKANKILHLAEDTPF